MRAFADEKLLGFTRQHQCGQREYDITGQNVLNRLRVQGMRDALVDRYTGPKRENQERDDEAPEINFPAISERVVMVRAGRSAMQAIQKQQLVPTVDNRMNAFA